MSATIECGTCVYCTDVEEISETNPTKCPKCGGELFYAGTMLTFPEPNLDIDDCDTLLGLCDILNEMKKTYSQREENGQGDNKKWNEYYGVDLTSMKTFGGSDLQDTEGIWSWDINSVMVYNEKFEIANR